MSPLLGGSNNPKKWDEVEIQVGTPLPSDYKAFIERFGAGCFNEVIAVFGIGVQWQADIVTMSKKILAADSDLRSEHPDLHPGALFPERDGVFPWGMTTDGEYLYWQTRGAPDTWGVAIRGYDADGEDTFILYDLTMTGFLSQVLTGALCCPIFPDDLLDHGVHFRSVATNRPNESPI